MSDYFLLRYETPAAHGGDMPSGTSTLTKAQPESGDADHSVALGAQTGHAPLSTGTFTSTGREAPDRDFMAVGSEFVFPH